MKQTHRSSLRGCRIGLLGHDSRFLLGHHRVLRSHPPSESSLELRAQGQFGQVVSLAWRGYKALILKTLILEPVEALCQMFDLGDSGVSGGIRSCEGGRGRVGRVAVGGTLRGQLR